MECPSWLAEFVKNVAECFETSGSIDWSWEEVEGEYEVKVFPCLMEIGDGKVGIDGDIRLDVGDALTFFDKSPAILWHMSGNEEGAFHIEGTVNGFEVWLWVMESPPPPEIPPEIIDDEPTDKVISNLN